MRKRSDSSDRPWNYSKYSGEREREAGRMRSKVGEPETLRHAGLLVTEFWEWWLGHWEVQSAREMHQVEVMEGHSYCQCQVLIFGHLSEHLR